MRTRVEGRRAAGLEIGLEEEGDPAGGTPGSLDIIANGHEGPPTLRLQEPKSAAVVKARRWRLDAWSTLRSHSRSASRWLWLWLWLWRIFSSFSFVEVTSGRKLVATTAPLDHSQTREYRHHIVEGTVRWMGGVKKEGGLGLEQKDLTGESQTQKKALGLTGLEARSHFRQKVLSTFSME